MLRRVTLRRAPFHGTKRPANPHGRVSPHGRVNPDGRIDPDGRTTLTICQELAATPGALPVIKLGAIGGPKDANSHSVANPVGEVAGATTHRTPPLAYPTGGWGRESDPAPRVA